MVWFECHTEVNQELGDLKLSPSLSFDHLLI